MRKIVLWTVISLLIIAATVMGCVSRKSDANDSESDPILTYEYSKGLNFKEYDDYCVLVGLGDCTDEDIYIPDTYNGKPVTEITALCMEYNYHIKSVTIPDTVTLIYSSAFMFCPEITTINLPQNLKSLDIGLFTYSDAIEKIVLPESLEVLTGVSLSRFNKDHASVNKYKNGLYLGSKKNPYLVLIGIENSNEIKEFSVHKDTRIILDATFFYAGGSTSIETINMFDSVEYISDNAFYGCTALKSIKIPKSVKHMGTDVFSGCTSLESISISDSIEYVGRISDLPNLKYNEYKNGLYLGSPSNPYEVLVGVKDKAVNNFTINGSTEVIAQLAFYRCGNLVSIDIPDSVTNICQDAFYVCNSLTSVTLSNSIEELDYTTFSWCDNLKQIVVPRSVKRINTPITKTPVQPGGSIYICPVDIYFEGNLEEWLEIKFEGSCSTNVGDLYINNELVTDVVIPNGVKHVSDYAFAGFGKIKTVSIPSSVTKIGKNAFSGCVSLESVSIPNSVTKISDYAFASCDSLTSITIPNSVISIGDYAFGWCESLTSITLPDSVAKLGEYAFAYCTSLKNVEIPNSITSIEANTFSDCTSLENITIPDSVVSISYEAFIKCNALKYTVENDTYYLGNESNPYLYLVKCDDAAITKFTIPNATKVVHPKAFANCDALVEINIPEYISNIDYFGYTNKITSYDVLKVTELHPNNKHYAIIDGNLYSKDGTILIKYYGAEDEYSFEVPNTVTEIGPFAFACSFNVKNIVVPDSVKTIGSCAFAYCRDLESITLPNSIGKIENETFLHCPSLKTIKIPNSVKFIGGGAFQSCTQLTDLEIGDSVVVIFQSAFSSCKSLTDVKIPDSVRHIYSRAFNNCKNLKSLELGKSIKNIDNEAFYNCSSLEIIKINGSSAIGLGRYAFKGCAITRIEFNGTIEEWKVAGKLFSNTNNVTGKYTVYCTDGEITRSGLETHY